MKLKLLFRVKQLIQFPLSFVKCFVTQKMLSPKFLHTNSTSHTWPFSAIAELIDNAYDPDVSARQIWIDKTIINDNICLTFTDNGNGMNCEKLHKMLRRVQ
ncbi:hypothetical protein DV515_00017852 [Chloebia gouldiae]|uniref:Histidine kinase/HSP90-like ATPase domain-containing protein n=1 Tax=Chloebia gouldiae TaxID=44316 RepID=A0A3L8Q9C6_CHLGU|nr:hypothetical protein DV515_00017852 [Chloebia gouldiae]